MTHKGMSFLRCPIFIPIRPIKIIDKTDEHLTFGLAIFADGSYMNPLLIVPKVNCPPMPDNCKQFYRITGSSTGWITRDIFVNWVQKELIPEIWMRRFLVVRNPYARALFVVDAHNSRDDEDLKASCAAAGIDVIILPAHSSTVLQPLDLIINGQFKRILNNYYEPEEGLTLQQRRSKMLELSAWALQGAMIPLYIIKSFEKAGVLVLICTT